MVMIDLHSPTRIIQIKNLSRPIDIQRWCKKAKLQKYCYAFYVVDPSTNQELAMNIGMSIGGEIGDRIYRKVGNLPGWGSLALTGDFGADMKRVVEEFEKKYTHIKVDKNQVNLHLWDTNNLTSQTIIEATIQAEKTLISQYEEIYGSIPVGNFQDPRTRNKSGIVTQVFNDLFAG
jgi:hypothetical protein